MALERNSAALNDIEFLITELAGENPEGGDYMLAIAITFFLLVGIPYFFCRGLIGYAVKTWWKCKTKCIEKTDQRRTRAGLIITKEQESEFRINEAKELKTWQDSVKDESDRLEETEKEL